MTTEQRNGTIGNLLAIDTSTAVLTLALSAEGKLIAERCSQAERNHSIKLLPEIDDMLKEAGIAPSELDAVAVGDGPGSYTGVRIGVTVAKTFAWTLGIPVYGVSSLEALALGDAHTLERESGLTSPHWYVPLLDARRKQAFCAVYATGSNGWHTVAEDGIRIVHDWLEPLSELIASARERGAGPERIVFGGETAGFRDAIEAWSVSGNGSVLTDIRDSRIGASAIAELAWRRIASGGEPDDTHGIVPNYTQLAEAEAKLLQKEKRGGEPLGAN
ncbi:tRNA (adenosine(37)-N6)-threonylcarbamoyltransferase complex dimerization subunit type 1 TsaB [Paenibacillus mesophilus]|uniref:tRNA (adenosine(37)-N6)-threonylcarbamoyltransferase complex dimerization subunit type 1 TsaB n=1 Tax=Paenibacillus mesophilus TaxID=2582849 RepID=UPI00110F69D7|nr:tRNA (adenosine(37)-N6)-threonylcarbamoyltransferase complex dimerization subunit type 1 TsaB [Paenibacillus mesophilus]TMV50822.1 tRNA (adenosine(37)-N6)-threonylcarbamoyltransferase complex dimerization subunit type 1 TsaB [Paenibacillus mesophilus]